MRYRNKRNRRVCEALVITKDTVPDDILHFAPTRIKRVEYNCNTLIIKLNNNDIYLNNGDVLVKYRTEIDVLYKEEFEENFEEIKLKEAHGCGYKGCSHSEGERENTISIDLTFSGDFDSVEFTDEMRDFAIRKITKAIREQGR